MNSEPSPRVRLAPGTRREIGFVNDAITRILGVAAGSNPPNVFTTLARHRGLFRRWLVFAGGLMPGGVLPRADAELVILRVAHNCGSDYELDHHRRLAADAGVDTTRIAAATGAGAAQWTARELALVTVADELHADRRISDTTWESLCAVTSERERIELCLLVGHYEMLAMSLNSFGTPLDRFAATPSRLQRMIARVVNR